MNPNTLRKIKRLEAGESFITSEPGNSMLPLYKSNEKHLVTPIKWEDCKVGDPLDFLNVEQPKSYFY